MEPATVMESLNAIGAAAGIPAALLIGYLFLRVKELGAAVEKLKAAREEDRKDADSKLSEIYNKLNALLSDVSYIRGKLED